MKTLYEVLEWLNQEPEADLIQDSPEGGRHIPIEKLKPLLTELDPFWGTENFKWNYMLIGGAMHLSSSVELIVTYGDKKRRLAGASTFDVNTYGENTHYVAIGLSEAIKNSAKNLGKRFGSELNLPQEGVDVLPKQKTNGRKIPVKINADKEIRKQYASAVARMDSVEVSKLESMYNFE